MNKKILFILQYDSFIKTFIPVFEYFNKKNINYKIILFNKWHKKEWITYDIEKILSKTNYKKIKTQFQIIRNWNKKGVENRN